MTQAQFIAEVYEITWQYNPDLDKNLSFEDCIEVLKKIKDDAMRMEILRSSFRPEPELFPIKERRQGQL
tara:strand:- start:348 stop:554 length:207 start_codon:yes stop_codon:yes gene_type:complete